MHFSGPNPGISNLLALSVLILWIAPSAGAQPADYPGVPKADSECSWSPGFSAPGPDWAVFDMVSWDDGNGPALYVSGIFRFVDSIRTNGLAKWDGKAWTSLGVDDLNNGIRTLAVYDDGTGSALYAGGSFLEMVEGIPANGIAKWDGVSWAPVGGGIDGTIYSMTVYDDGNGPALYVGGAFTEADGSPASSIAKWDGESWSPLGTGTDGTVYALTTFDDGNGNALYAAGIFNTAGEEVVNRIGKWNGQEWSALGSGLVGSAKALAVYDDGNGSALYVGGAFGQAGGAPASNIARWDGTEWSTLGSGLDNEVESLVVHQDLGGASLYAGGKFDSAGGVPASRIARWSGKSWQAVGDGSLGGSGGVFKLAVFDDGNDRVLYAGGYLSNDLPDGESISYLLRFDGESWQAIGDVDASNGFTFPQAVFRIQVYDDGRGPAPYAAGLIQSASGIALNGIGRWDGESWEALDVGLDGVARTLSVWVDGADPILYVGGDFSLAGDEEASHIAGWNGDRWVALGDGLNGPVASMAIYDDGAGSALFVAGTFTEADGVGANNIAKWNGESWETLGLGIEGAVEALEVYDDGTGPALYAGGSFDRVAGMETRAIAKWDGEQWTPMDEGPVGGIRQLAVFEGRLFASGSFTEIEGIPTGPVAAWDGEIWSPAATDYPERGALSSAVYDDGKGPSLYVSMRDAAHPLIPRLMKWNGLFWTEIEPSRPRHDAFLAISPIAEENGSSLFVGGRFRFLGEVPSAGIGRHSCPNTPPLDVTITLSNGADALVAGEATIYEMAVSNPTTLDAPKVRLMDALPAELKNCSWTPRAGGLGGASGYFSGSGDLMDATLAMPAGAEVLYSITCDVDPSATGQLAHSATITTPLDGMPGNDVAVDTDVIIQVTDLGLTLSNGTEEVTTGGTVTYSLGASNAGPSDAIAVSLTADLPTQLVGCRWRSVAEGNASGHTSGAGSMLDETLNLPAGSSVQYVISCAVPASATGPLIAEASVSTETDPDTTNNTDVDEDPLAEQPNVSTLILTHPGRMLEQGGATLSELELLTERLHQFAEHTNVDGLVLDVGYHPEIGDLYDLWDTDVADGYSDPQAANRVLFGCDNPLQCGEEKSGVHDFLLSVLASRTDVEYLVLVGDDRIFPMARIPDFTEFPSEIDYTPLGDFTPGLTPDQTTVGQALARNRYLSDDPIAQRNPVIAERLERPRLLLRPKLATGRLVETPGEMLRALDVFLEKDGRLDLTQLDPDHRVLVTGYDFLVDSAKRIRKRWKAAYGLPDDPGDLVPVDGLLIGRTWGLPTAEERADALLDHLSGMGSGAYGVMSLNGHATHYEEGVPGENIQDIQGLSVDRLAELPEALQAEGSLIYAVGCHGGLPVAGASATEEDHPLDLPQTFLGQGALAYAANSGFGWGFLHTIGYSEKLVTIFTEELARPDTVILGQAVLDTKRRYYLEEPYFSFKDIKTSLQWTLFGFPMLRIQTGLVSQSFDSGTGPVVSESGSGGCVDLPDHLECQVRSNVMSEFGSFTKYRAGGEEPLEATEGCPPPDEGEPEGCYYTLNELTTAEEGWPVEPILIEDSRRAGTSQHGVLWTGGLYEEEAGWVPVLAQPVSNGGAIDLPGPLPQTTYIRPRVRGAGGPLGDAPNCAPTDTELNTLVLIPAELIYDANLEPTRHRLHHQIDVEIFYYNNNLDGNGNCDRLGPQIEDGPYHVLDGETVRWSVAASDEAGGDNDGVWRVVVVWDDEIENRWRPLELAFDETSGRWLGELPRPGGVADRVVYFLQAVDHRGNVSWVNYEDPGLSLGSGTVDSVEPGLPLPVEAVFPTSSLLFADDFESGNCSAWSVCP